MGLLDFGAKIVAEYKADTKDIKSKLRELSGEEKKLAEQRLKDAEAHNAQLEGQIKKIGKVALAIGAAGAAIAVGRAGFQAYAKETQLATAAAGANIDKLSQAAGGLATRMELLEFAAKTQHGAFKLNNEQMETAQKAILAITRAGYDHAEATNKVTEALVKANGGALDDFGILVKSGSNDLENFNNLMDALAKKASEADGATGGTAESVARAGVKFEDAFNKIKSAIGQMVVALEPLISAAAKLTGLAAGLIGKIAQGYSEIGGFGSFIFGGGEDYLRGYGLQRDKDGNLYKSDAMRIAIDELGDNYFSFTARKARGELQRQGSNDLIGGFQQFGRDFWESGLGIGGTVGNTVGGLRESRGAGRGAGRASTDWGRFRYDAMGGGNISSIDPYGDRFYNPNSGALGQAAAGYDPTADLDRIRLAEEEVNRVQALTDDWYKRLDFQGPTLLDRVLGDVTTIDAQTGALQALTGTWGAFSSGVSAGYSAMVDGSTSFGKAFKQATAESLKAMGAEASVNAVKELALGFASLAIGPIGGASAAAHFKSAALFGSVAALAGVTASALGTGAGGGSAGGAAAASGARSYASSGGSNSNGNAEPTRIIVYADAFAEDSERSKRLQAEKVVKRAYGSGAVENG